MEKRIITVYIDNMPYRLGITINKKGKVTTYQVMREKDAARLDDVVPENMEFDVDGHVSLDERIRTVKGEQIARIIWKGIRDQLDE